MNRLGNLGCLFFVALMVNHASACVVNISPSVETYPVDPTVQASSLKVRVGSPDLPVAEKDKTFTLDTGQKYYLWTEITVEMSEVPEGFALDPLRLGASFQDRESVIIPLVLVKPDASRNFAQSVLDDAQSTRLSSPQLLRLYQRARQSLASRLKVLQATGDRPNVLDVRIAFLILQIQGTLFERLALEPDSFTYQVTDWLENERATEESFVKSAIGDKIDIAALIDGIRALPAVRYQRLFDAIRSSASAADVEQQCPRYRKLRELLDNESKLYEDIARERVANLVTDALSKCEGDEALRVLTLNSELASQILTKQIHHLDDVIAKSKSVSPTNLQKRRIELQGLCGFFKSC